MSIEAEKAWQQEQGAGRISSTHKSSDQTRGEAIGSHSIEYEPDLGWGYRLSQ